MLQISNCEQGTPEWHAARAGIPTASEFHKVLARGIGKDDDSQGRRNYLLTLAGEILTGETVEGFSNAHMERGKVMEAEARDLYTFRSGAELERVGFIRNDRVGAGVSPDSLIGKLGMLEIKTKIPRLQLELLIDGRLPSIHKAQCQGALWVAEREWLDFASYWPRLPLFLVRVQRDEKYIAGLKVAVDDFNAELQQLVERFKL